MSALHPQGGDQSVFGRHNLVESSSKYFGETERQSKKR